MRRPTFLVDHLRHERPEKPQSYRQHGAFAMKNSWGLLLAGLAGIIHAVFPWWFRFYSAEQVVRTYSKIAASGRHDELLARYGLTETRESR